jgi:hypothetical protein
MHAWKAKAAGRRLPIQLSELLGFRNRNAGTDQTRPGPALGKVFVGEQPLRPILKMSW